VNEWQVVAIVAGCVSGIGVCLLLVATYFRSRSRAVSQIHDGHFSGDDIKDFADRMERLADELGRRGNELEGLLSEAQEAINTLRPELPTLRRQCESTVNGADQPSSPEQADTIHSSHREVLRLKAQGLDEIEIARRTQMGVGEVQLVLNLRPTSHLAK